MNYENDTPRDHTARLVFESISRIIATREKVTITNYTMQSPEKRAAKDDAHPTNPSA